MVDRNFEIHKQSQAKDVTLLKKHLTLEIDVIDDADTITLPSLTTIDNAKVINLSTGVDITVNIAGNIITVSDITVTAAHVIVMAVGV